MFFKLKIIKLLLVLSIFFCESTNSNKIKNVLLLLADDGGFEMGAYLNRFCQTPNLDELAKKSLIFNNAFTSVSSCSPSRAQILTGQPSHQNGMYGLHQSYHHFNVFDSIESLPNLLKSKSNVYTGLIGKKHVGPSNVIKFDYEQTEEQHSINQIGRNITNIKNYVNVFLKNAKENAKPFFLMVSFHDPHRCGHVTPQFGEFCERWGSGENDMGLIPDWHPIYYDWRNLEIPPYLPQTDAMKRQLSAQYQTVSRLDQGIGLVIKQLELNGFSNNTLIIYTSDNGPPFPGGRTNFYDAGIREPMFIHSPDEKARKNSVTSSMASLLDIYSTVLNSFNVTSDHITTSKSLLPLLYDEPKPNDLDAIYGSQNFHEITMNYPMRMVRTRRYKLIHNLNSNSYFPIDQDLYTSEIFQEILNSTATNEYPWYKTLKSYYIRSEWELYDIKFDPLEKYNLVDKLKFKAIRKNLQKQLFDWQWQTKDPWRCAPHAVLEESGEYKDQPECLTLKHEEL